MSIFTNMDLKAMAPNLSMTVVGSGTVVRKTRMTLKTRTGCGTCRWVFQCCSKDGRFD
jgi:hypothetical protein